jgi:glycosyltransferase involved in cell wall biosynthesis
MTERRMIFATPRPVEEGNSGSMMRMRAMREAFHELGYHVDEIAGQLETRMAAMTRVRARMTTGTRYDFAYFETHTIPLHMTEPKLRLLRRYPFADLQFLRACRRHGVAVGVFYRDVWWRFSSYRRSVPATRRWLRSPFYWLELLLYARFADVLYLPHLAMAEALPLRPARVKALPPGTAAKLAPAPIPPLEGELRIFYVGGIGPFYRLHRLIEAVGRVQGASLTICCRPQEWQSCRDSYQHLLSGRVKIVHAHGKALLQYFREAHVLSCFVSPDPYWRTTMPIKLFEYLGAGRPILAPRCSNAGAFVAEHDVGWAVADDAGSIAALLERLKASPDELERKAANASRIAPRHTWQARALQVAEDLTSLANDPAVRRADPGLPSLEREEIRANDA